MSTWLITGCSTGLGRALAEAVIAAGHNAVVTARDISKVADATPTRSSPWPSTSPRPSRHRRHLPGGEPVRAIDVLVNNAGYGYRSAIEEGSQSDIQAQSTPMSSASSHCSGPCCPASETVAQVPS
jgi:NAD(P)-dependent dehydrogenase (short-subunit alcohol dehydrogenase family)